MSPGVVLAAAWLLASPARAAAPGPPAPALVSPAAGASLSGTVVLIATVPSPSGLAGIQFLLDGEPLGAPVISPPYRLEWDTTRAAGDTHLLTAAAFNAAGARSASPGVTVLVDNSLRPPPPAAEAPVSPAAAADSVAPIVLLMNPSPGAVVSSSVTVSANASDNVAVSSVVFLLDGVELTPALTSAPYTFRWNSTMVVDGNHALAAVARDAAGNSATSVVTLSVENVPAVISGVVPSGVTANGASLIWKTDKPADSSVDYGPTPSYGLTAAAPARAIGHVVALKGLAPSTVYHYRVRSRGAGGLLTVSEDNVFTTEAGAAAAGAAAAPLAAAAKAPQKFLSPALHDGINDEAKFGPAAREVTVFDVRGRKVFHAGSGGPGNPLVWKCRDDSGRMVESGVYVARIVTQDSGVQFQTFSVAK